MAAPRNQEGFTLIELVVALTILAIAIFGISSVFYASIRTGDADVRRTAAVGLAGQAVGDLRGVSSVHRGLTPGDSSPACSPGAPIVFAPAAAFPTHTSNLLGGMTYSIDRCVSLAPASNGDADAQVLLSALVSWTDQTGTHTVRQDTLAPKGDPSNPAGGACDGEVDGPSSLSVRLPTPNSAELTWAPPERGGAIDHWTVAYSVDGMTTNVFATDVPASQPAMTLTGLAPATAYTFSVGALAAGCASAPTQVTVTTGGALAAGCAVGLLSSTPSAVARNGDGTLGQPVVVAANALGSCAGLQLRFSPSTAPAQALGFLNAGGSVWQVTIPATSDAWDLGIHQLSVLSASGQDVGDLSLCIENTGQTSC